MYHPPVAIDARRRGSRGTPKEGAGAISDENKIGMYPGDERRTVILFQHLFARRSRSKISVVPCGNSEAYSIRRCFTLMTVAPFAFTISMSRNSGRQSLLVAAYSGFEAVLKAWVPDSMSLGLKEVSSPNSTAILISTCRTTVYRIRGTISTCRSCVSNDCPTCWYWA